MTTDWTERLSEYLDGELDREETAALESSLAEQPELRGLLDGLRAVKQAAATRPDLEAPPGLWQAIRGRLEPRHSGLGRPAGATRRYRLMFTLPQLAAAAGVVLLLGFSLGRISDQARSTTGGDFVAQSSEPVAESAASPRYAQFVADLEARLETGRDVLEPGTARVIEESLAKIDAAIAQARTALENDPNNVYLNQHLASAQWRKLRLLEDATALIASRT